MRIVDRWYQIYEETAGKYDSVISKARIPHFLTLIRMMKIRGDEHVVDFGCGPGNLTREIFPYVVKCTGVDASPAMIAQARTSLKHAEWVVADAAKTGLPDEAFDAGMSSQLLPWLPDPGAFLKEAHRVLKPGAALGLITAASGSYREFFHAFEKLVRTYEDHYHTDDVAEVFGSKAYSLVALERMLEQAGFELENWTILTVEVPTPASEYLDFIRMFTGDQYLAPLPQNLRAEAKGRLGAHLERDGLTLNEKSTIIVARKAAPY